MCIRDRPGSIGACSYPAKVFKGMRMGGQLGGDRVIDIRQHEMAVGTAHERFAPLRVERRRISFFFDEMCIRDSK